MGSESSSMYKYLYNQWTVVCSLHQDLMMEAEMISKMFNNDPIFAQLID
jgi:hypothetical protein